MQKNMKARFFASSSKNGEISSQRRNEKIRVATLSSALVALSLLSACAANVYVDSSDTGKARVQSPSTISFLTCVTDSHHQVCEVSGFRRTQGMWVEYKNREEFARYKQTRTTIENDSAVFYGVDTRPIYIRIEKQKSGNFYYAYYAWANTPMENAKWTQIMGKLIPTQYGYTEGPVR